MPLPPGRACVAHSLSLPPGTAIDSAREKGKQARWKPPGCGGAANRFSHGFLTKPGSHPCPVAGWLLTPQPVPQLPQQSASTRAQRLSPASPVCPTVCFLDDHIAVPGRSSLPISLLPSPSPGLLGESWAAAMSAASVQDDSKLPLGLCVCWFFRLKDRWPVSRGWCKRF